MLDYSREIAPGRRFNAPGGARRARRAAECVPDGYGVSVRRPPDDGVEDVGHLMVGLRCSPERQHVNGSGADSAPR